MKKIYSWAMLLIAGAAVVTGCKKEFDSPPEKQVPEGTVINIRQLKDLYTNNIVRFTEDKSVYGVVTADEKSGNFYKQVYVQDTSGAILLNLMSTGGLYIGDSVRIALKGTRLIYTSGVYQLDSVNVDNNVFKQGTNKNVVPKTITMSDLSNVSKYMQGRLVKLENVQFTCNDVGTTYSDAVSFSTTNKTIEDCSGGTVILRTSGYSNFAGSQVKKGKGSLVAILGLYNTTPQLQIRNLDDVQMTDNDADRCPNTSCSFYLKKNFEDGSVTSNSWTNYNVSGSVNWVTNTTASTSGAYYCQISNYTAGVGNAACETWLISSAVDLSASTTPVLSFINATKYTGPAMELYISTNYSSGAPSTATWTPLAYTASSGNFSWANSGSINLSAYKGANVRIAFKYTGSATQGATWEIDDVLIKEQ